MADGPKPGDWRQQIPASNPKAGPRAWQTQTTPAAAPRGPLSRRTKLGIALGVFSGLLGLLVVVLRWLIPIKPACLILLGASYDNNLNLPHNVLGWKSLEDLAGLAEKSGMLSGWLPWSQSGKMRLEFEPRQVDPQSPWEKTWAQLPSSFAEKTALIVLSFHGAGDGREPYLLTDDRRGVERVGLDKILKDLEEPRFQDKNKVLILDVTQVQGHWPSGVLYNDFARQLTTLKKKIEDQPNLVVLCSSDVDQVAFGSEEWRRTIFLHYVIEGIKGAADRDGNTRVSALELFQYVKSKVETWVQANREALQTPILLGGEDRAADIDLVQISETYSEQNPGDAPGGSFVAPAELENAWKECQGLRENVPAPWIYSPHLWQLYQDTLLRYEQLVRAGDPTAKAADLRSAASRLREKILASLAMDQAEAAPVLNTALPLVQVLGVKEPWTERDLKGHLDKLWDASLEEKEKIWAKVQSWAQGQLGGRDERTYRHLLQTRFSGQLLQQLIRKENLTLKDLGPPLAPQKGEAERESRARTLLRLVEKLGGARTAEAHFLLMLLQDVDAEGKLQVEDLRLALDVRLLAEETAFNYQATAQHPYSEIISPWIRSRIEKADELRRRGEDWLFGSSKNAVQEARNGLDKAREKYKEIRPDEELLRQALDTRDRVLADLPYYAQWVAGQRRLEVSTEDGKKSPILVLQIERLARNVQTLSQRLQEVPGADLSSLVPADEDNPQRLPMKELLKDLLGKIRDDYSDPIKGIQVAYKGVCAGLQEVHLQSRWHEIEDALSIPLVEEAGVRMTLLRNSRGYSSKLNSGSLKSANISLGEKESQVKEQAQRQQRLALAVIGPRYAKDLQIETAAEIPWRDAVVRNGQEIGRFWQQQPDAINKNLADSVAAVEVKKALPALVEGDYRCRWIHGGGAALLESEPFGVPEGLRRLRLHDLLIWQAQRTVNDHWYADTESLEKTFYMPTAKAHLKLANRLAEAKSNDEDHNRKRQADVRKAEEKVVLAGIQLENLSQPHWTSELRFPLRWKVEAQEGVPQGVPMVWFGVQKPFQASENLQGRKPLENWPPDPIAYTLERPENKSGTRGVSTLHGLYRGQHWQSTQDIQLHKEPEIIAYNVPPPPRSGVALRMDKDFNYGAVSIVLDTSGSMAFGYPDKKSSPVKRFEYARKALRVALEAIPDGTYLSLLTFVHDPASRTSSPRLVQPPKLWKASAHLEDFMDRVDALPTIGGTPLAKTLVEARRKGFPTNFQGPKVVLVLTDGDDTESVVGIDPKTQQAVYNNAVRKLVASEFEDSGVEVQMVIFTDQTDLEGEAKNAEEQFKKVLDSIIPPGTFVIQPEGAQLAATLELAIRPHLKLYQGTVLVKDFKPLPASMARREVEWRVVKPGSYESLVHRQTQNIYLESGDLLELALKRQGNAVVMERNLFGPENRYKLASQELGDWAVSVVQNHVEQRTGQVQQLVAIEEKPVSFKTGNLLKQIHPGFMWMEVQARGEKKPGQFRWHKEFTYPAPTFRLMTRDWPFKEGEQPVPAEVKVWWHDRPYPQNDAYSSYLEWIPAKYRYKRTIVGNTGTGFTIESIEVEEHKVSTTPWFDDRTLKRCVVVRIAHDPGKPVWVQLRGEKGSPGEEHHYYSGVNKYTAYFWGVSNPDTEGLDLNVISLADFKKQTHEVSFALPAPTTVLGPLPVLKLIQEP